MKVFLYVLTLFFAFALLSLVDIPSLLKKKEWKELIIASSLFIIGFILNFLLIIGVELPNPNQMITLLIQSLFG